MPWTTIADNRCLYAALCPSNVGTTITEMLQAFGHDVEQAVRIASICFNRGPSGCVCSVMMMIKPAWIDGLQGTSASDTALKKCKGGDPFDFLMLLVTDEILKWLSDGVNW